MLNAETTANAVDATARDRNLALQWARLVALSGVHFLADVFPGTMHAVLPEIQGEFVLSTTLGAVFLATFNFTCNWTQVFTGHLRADRTRPLYMYVGLIFAAMICLLAVLPRTPASFPVMLVLAVVCGCGVAIVHPEALRALHALDRIKPATSTAVFMTGGILGFALGGKYSTELITHFGGVQGLLPLALCPIFCILAIAFLKAPLAVEPRRPSCEPAQAHQTRGLPFWPIMVMGSLAGISTSIIVWIVPQRLEDLEFPLTFGGFSVMLFSLGAGAGSFFWAALTRRVHHIGCTMAAVFLGVPLMVAYALTVEHRWAVWLLLAASFCAFGSYPLMVSMARGAFGPRLGLRMGLMVGGTWGVSSLFPMVLAPVADEYGTQLILQWSWVGYALACAAGAYLLFTMRGAVKDMGRQPCR